MTPFGSPRAGAVRRASRNAQFVSHVRWAPWEMNTTAETMPSGGAIDSLLRKRVIPMSREITHEAERFWDPRSDQPGWGRRARYYGARYPRTCAAPHPRTARYCVGVGGRCLLPRSTGRSRSRGSRAAEAASGAGCCGPALSRARRVAVRGTHRCAPVRVAGIVKGADEPVHQLWPGGVAPPVAACEATVGGSPAEGEADPSVFRENLPRLEADADEALTAFVYQALAYPDGDRAGCPRPFPGGEW